MLHEQIYRTEVFFIESLGFLTPTEARRMDLADSIRFGELHEQTYAAYGFRPIRVRPAPVAQRVAAVRQELIVALHRQRFDARMPRWIGRP